MTLINLSGTRTGGLPTLDMGPADIASCGGSCETLASGGVVCTCATGYEEAGSLCESIFSHLTCLVYDTCFVY